MTNDIFVATGINEGEKVRLTRITKKLRQIDIIGTAQPVFTAKNDFSDFKEYAIIQFN